MSPENKNPQTLAPPGTPPGPEPGLRIHEAALDPSRLAIRPLGEAAVVLAGAVIASRAVGPEAGTVAAMAVVPNIKGIAGKAAYSAFWTANRAGEAVFEPASEAVNKVTGEAVRGEAKDFGKIALTGLKRVVASERISKKLDERSRTNRSEATRIRRINPDRLTWAGVKKAVIDKRRNFHSKRAAANDVKANNHLKKQAAIDAEVHAPGPSNQRLSSKEVERARKERRKQSRAKQLHRVNTRASERTLPPQEFKRWIGHSSSLQTDHGTQDELDRLESEGHNKNSLRVRTELNRLHARNQAEIDQLLAETGTEFTSDILVSGPFTGPLRQGLRRDKAGNVVRTHPKGIGIFAESGRPAETRLRQKAAKKQNKADEYRQKSLDLKHKSDALKIEARARSTVKNRKTAVRKDQRATRQLTKAQQLERRRIDLTAQKTAQINDRNANRAARASTRKPAKRWSELDIF